MTLRGTLILCGTWLISLTCGWLTWRVGSSLTYSDSKAIMQVSNTYTEFSPVLPLIYGPSSSSVSRSVIPATWFVYEILVCMEMGTTARRTINVSMTVPSVSGMLSQRNPVVECGGCCSTRGLGRRLHTCLSRPTSGLLWASQLIFGLPLRGNDCFVPASESFSMFL